MANLSLAKQTFEHYLETANADKHQHIVIDNHQLQVGTSFYKPSKTGFKFHSSDKRVRCIIGPYGSGKSTLCCADIVEWGCGMPAMPDGIRRSRFAIIRNTYGELESTTLKTWLDWFDELGEVKTKVKPPYVHHTFNDGNGKVEIELLFLALDRPDHIKKLKSLELTGAYLNEACELPKVILDHILTRVNRYPSRRIVKNYRSGVILDTNPPPTSNWIYRLFEVNRPEGFEIFHQPAGLLKTDDGYVANPDADNIENLADTYYTDMTQGNSEEFIRVYACGEYGVIKSGKPVYPQYNDDWHSVDHLEPIEGLPIDLAWDFGLTPSALCTQTTADGRLLCLKEICATKMGLENFLEHVFFRVFNETFPGYVIGHSVGDPAGNTAAQTDESTCLGILNDFDIPTDGAPTNEILPRLEAVWKLLNSSPDGKPAILINRNGCPVLREGFLGLYAFERLNSSNDEVYKDKPDKNEYSHIHDALQYRALLMFNAKRNRPDDEPVDYSVFISNPLAKMGYAS